MERDYYEEEYDDSFYEDDHEERTYERYNGSYAQDVEGWSDQDIDDNEVDREDEGDVSELIIAKDHVNDDKDKNEPSADRQTKAIDLEGLGSLFLVWLMGEEVVGE